LIKRFSAKEEKRRIVAAVWSGDRTPAFDNKLNYIHANGHGLDPEVARGLAYWLNSTQVDDYFRVFSGHTQVNAGDLRQMKFPSLDQLRALGRSVTDDIDSAVEHVTNEKTEVAA
jgi:adenine-specific DNA-methyltransferase